MSSRWSKLLDAIDLEPKGKFSAIHPQSPVWKRDEVACTRSILNRFPFSSTNSAVGTSDSKAIPRRLSTNSLVVGWWVSKEHVTRVLVSCLTLPSYPALRGELSPLIPPGEVTPMQLRCLIPQNCGQMCRHKAWFRAPQVVPLHDLYPKKDRKRLQRIYFRLCRCMELTTVFQNQLRVNWVGNLWRKRGGKFRLDSFR